MLDRKQQFYVWLTAIFVAALVTGDFIGGRFWLLFGHTLSAGIIPFPLTFVLTDVVNEFYGPSGARRLTFVGLGAAVFVWLVITLALHLPPSPQSPIPDPVFQAAFGTAARLYVASLTAFVIGQMLDISIFRCAAQEDRASPAVAARHRFDRAVTGDRQLHRQLRVPRRQRVARVHHPERRQQLRRQADHGGAADARHLRDSRDLPATVARRRTS